VYSCLFSCLMGLFYVCVYILFEVSGCGMTVMKFVR
jgi:hypothetical protein